MTWAQVQTLTNTSAGGSAPYLSLAELLAYVGPNVPLFIDPKHIPAVHYPQIIAALAGRQWVGKFYGIEGGVGNNGWAKACADAGVERWGYFYPEDLAHPDIESYLGRWTLLGFPWDADPSDWANISSLSGFSKPIIGHICPSLAAITDAIGKGASGVMVSKVSVL